VNAESQSDKFIVRDAVAADVPALAWLLGELGYPVTPPDFARRLEKFTPEHRTFVAEGRAGVAGFVGCSALHVYESDTRVCWIMALCVAPRFRRQGVGRTLVERVDQWCRDAGCRDIRVHSGNERRDAHAFYQACGYECSGLRFVKSLA
jgi:GNAT superfamily N-acetyltransferase